MFVQGDAKALEWRIPVEFSRDETAIRELLTPGADIHAINQAEFKLPERVIAKRFLFRTIFRGTGYAFSIDNEFKHVSTDPKYWDERNKMFYQKYNGLDRLHQSWIEQVSVNGYLTAFTGRRWDFPRIPRENYKTRQIELVVPLNDLVNHPVQGTGNDLVMIARITLRNRLTKYKIPAIIVSTVHDSIVVDTPKEYVKDVVEIMTESFNDIVPNVKRLFKYEMIIPIPCECKVGYNLSEMEEVK